MNIRMRQTGSILSALCCKYLWMAAFIVIALAAIHSEVIYTQAAVSGDIAAANNYVADNYFADKYKVPDDSMTVDYITEEKYNGSKLLYTYYGFANMDGIWYRFIEGSVDDGYTGMGDAQTGWAYFIRGVQSADYTGMAFNSAGWWYYINGNLIWDYTGIGYNEAGAWYYNNGNIDFTFTGTVECGGKVYEVTNGMAGDITPEPEEPCYTISCWGDSMTAGVGMGAAYMQTDEGIVDISNKGYPEFLQERVDDCKVNNFGFPGLGSDDITDNAEWYYSDGTTDDCVIIEIGSNGGWNDNYDTLIEQYHRIIDDSGADDYIIVGDTDDPGTSADISQSEYNSDGTYAGFWETKWERALSEEFGAHFFNTRLYLLENGLNDAWLTKTDEDREYLSRGRIPVSLRYDWTHFNEYGYYSKAKGIYLKGKELGYW